MSVENILSQYKYGRYNLQDGNFRIVETNKEFILEGFFKEKETTGDCVELSEHLYFNLKESNNIYKVLGSEPQFFRDLNTHMFLVNPKENLPLEFQDLDGGGKAKLLAKSEYNVIDPSFNLNLGKKQAAYEINQVVEEQYKKPTDLRLSKPYSYDMPPLLLEDNKMFELVTDDSQFYISLRYPGGNSRIYDLSSFDIDKFKELEGIGIIEKFQEAYINRTIER